jgi:hypothetical protein
MPFLSLLALGQAGTLLAHIAKGENGYELLAANFSSKQSKQRRV